MNWVEITVSINVKDLEKAEPIANMASPNGLYIEDYSNMEDEVLEIAHIDLIDEDLLAKRRDTALIHMFLSPAQNPAECELFLVERLKSQSIDFEISSQQVDDENWATAWKTYYKPTKIGEKIVVVPTWEEYSPSDGDVVINMDPGMAFGTGTHETTRLCIKAAEKYVFPECSVLDLGCGSGILSIASMLLGAKNAAAVDIDPVAVRTAGENAAGNGIPLQSYELISGNLTEDENIQAKLCQNGYDIIFANIIADVIMAFSPYFGSMLRPGGVVLASGVIFERKDEVIDRVCAEGFALKEVNQDKGWVGLVFEKC